MAGSFDKGAYILGLWLAFMSLALFIVMAADKRRARTGARRVPEARLFLLALLGGGIGGWLGMYVFHHKTKHVKFVVGFPLTALAQAAAFLYLLLK